MLPALGSRAVFPLLATLALTLLLNSTPTSATPLVVPAAEPPAEPLGLRNVYGDNLDPYYGPAFKFFKRVQEDGSKVIKPVLERGSELVKPLQDYKARIWDEAEPRPPRHLRPRPDRGRRPIPIPRNPH